MALNRRCLGPFPRLEELVHPLAFEPFVFPLQIVEKWMFLNSKTIFERAASIPPAVPCPAIVASLGLNA